MVHISASIGNTPYKTEIHGSHTITADEPLEKGGGDQGLNPGELLAASLASCSLITVQMYARRKGWDLQKASIAITYEHDMKENMASITKRLRLMGTLDDEQRQRLAHIASVCPIHRVLEKSVAIESFLEEGYES